MPIKDDEKRRAYFRDYMQRKRAGEKPKPADDLKAAQAKIRELEAELAKARRRPPKGFMEARTYKLILAALHPDRALSERRQTEAFQTFAALAKMLVRPG